MDDSISAKDHELVIGNRTNISLSGVTDVENFDENYLRIMTSCGGIEIKGENIQVTVLNLEEGMFSAEGRFNSVFYSDKMPKSGGFFSKVFR